MSTAPTAGRRTVGGTSPRSSRGGCPTSGPVRKSDGFSRAPTAPAGTRQPHTYHQYASGCRAPAAAPGAPRADPPDLRTHPLDAPEVDLAGVEGGPPAVREIDEQAPVVVDAARDARARGPADLVPVQRIARPPRLEHRRLVAPEPRLELAQQPVERRLDVGRRQAERGGGLVQLLRKVLDAHRHVEPDPQHRPPL